jgi:hypothetical protein
MPELLHKMDAYRRAANYLSIGQMYIDPTFFMRADQVEAAWQILMPMLGAWAGSHPRTFPNDVAGRGAIAGRRVAHARGARLETNHMRILVLDVGGTPVKRRAAGHTRRVEFPSGPKMTPAKLVAAVRAATAG